MININKIFCLTIVGGALYTASVSTKGIIGEHRVVVRADDNFQPQGSGSRVSAGILTLPGVNGSLVFSNYCYRIVT